MQKITYQCENRPHLQFERILAEVPNTPITCELCNIINIDCDPIFVESKEYDPSNDFHFPIEEDRIVQYKETKNGKTKTVYEIRECCYSEDYKVCFGASPAPYNNCQAESLDDIKKLAKECGHDDVIGRDIEVLETMNWDELDFG